MPPAPSTRTRRLRGLIRQLGPLPTPTPSLAGEDEGGPLPLVRVADLDVDASTNQGGWNQADQRRRMFRTPTWAKQTISLRPTHTLPLLRNIDRRIGDFASVRRMTGSTMFSGMAVVRGAELLFEKYAEDFGPEHVHSMQSMTKTNLNLSEQPPAGPAAPANPPAPCTAALSALPAVPLSRAPVL